MYVDGAGGQIKYKIVAAKRMWIEWISSAKK